MKPLNPNHNYWIARIPTRDTPILKPQLMTLTDIKYDQSAHARHDNYAETYIFSNDEDYIWVESNNEGDKFMYKSIGDFIVTQTSAKLIQIMDNNLHPERFEGGKLKPEVDYISLRECLEEINNNRPELLI